jgi:hypothetical protein
MRYIKEYKVFEAANSSFVKDFLMDLGFFMSMNLSHVTKMGKDEDSTKELVSMMQGIRKPVINGQSYFEFLRDNINKITNNPKLLSALMGIARDFLLFIEPRVKNFVVDGPSAKGVDYKAEWLNRIAKLKEDYKKIVS